MEGAEQEMRAHHPLPKEGSGDMAHRPGGVAKGVEAFRLGPLPGVPKEVQASFLLWLTAVGAGVLETIVRLIYSSAVGWDSTSGLVLRVIVYSVVVYVAARMRLGKRWARLSLAILLGGIGTLSLVIDPIWWLAGGNSLGDVLRQTDLLFATVAPIRVVHLAAVLGALVFMFLPAANTYFRAARPSTKLTLG